MIKLQLFFVVLLTAIHAASAGASPQERTQNIIRESLKSSEKAPDFNYVDMTSFSYTPKEFLLNTENFKATKALLKKALPQLKNGDKTALIKRTYFSLSKYVFELTNVENAIFKAVEKKDSAKLSRYLKNKKHAESLLCEYGLTHLRIPAADFFPLTDTNNRDWIVIREQKMPLSASYAQQKNLYSAIFKIFEHDQTVLEYFKMIFKQVTIFICLTGFDDIHYNNIPLDNDGLGITLPDLDYSFTEYDGHLTPAALKGIIDLLFIADHRLYDTIVITAAALTNQTSTQLMHTVLRHLTSPKAQITQDHLLEQIILNIKKRRSMHELKYKGMAVFESLNRWWNNNDEPNLW